MVQNKVGIRKKEGTQEEGDKRYSFGNFMIKDKEKFYGISR